MPDGEVLFGKYSAISNTTPVFQTGFGVSTLMMEIIVSYSEWTGHGYGEATTNDGRKYKVQF